MPKGARPFKYRGGYRAQPTLANGTRPCKDFEKQDDAVQWIAEQLANQVSENLPELGGPGRATLAQALHLYASLHTITKGGCTAELNRINNYLTGAGMTGLKLVTKDSGQRTLDNKPQKTLPRAFAEHRDERLKKREATYKLIAALAARRCASLTTADFRRLMVQMQNEGLSTSTIQKEIALLKHMFNVAEREWLWTGFVNPCIGLKLGRSEVRFVFLTEQQQVELRSALAQCDNPYFWPLVEICLQTTLRKSSLLAMSRTNVDLDGRIAMLPSKTGQVPVPLSEKAVQILRAMPTHPSGKYFPMSANAVDMAWDGVRQKIGMPELQFKDLRHVGATAYAKQGANTHQLQRILGHRSPAMAAVYVNLVNNDLLSFLDSIAHKQQVYQVPAPADASGKELLNRNRSRRLVGALAEVVKAAELPPPGPGGALGQSAIPDAGSNESLSKCASRAQAIEHLPDTTTIMKPQTAVLDHAIQATGALQALRATGTDLAPCLPITSRSNVFQVDFKRRT
jgi:integrase